jgi:hypothetical protein
MLVGLFKSIRLLKPHKVTINLKLLSCASKNYNIFVIDWTDMKFLLLSFRAQSRSCELIILMHFDCAQCDRAFQL